MKRYNVKITKRVKSEEKEQIDIPTPKEKTNISKFYSLLQFYVELNEYSKETSFNPFLNRLQSLISKLS